MEREVKDAGQEERAGILLRDMKGRAPRDKCDLASSKVERKTQKEGRLRHR